MIDERVIARHLARQGLLTNRSGTVAAGGAAQQAAPANPERRYLLVQNPTASPDTLWVRFGATATAASPSIELPPGATLVFEAEFVPTDSVSVIAATPGTPFTAWEG